jgi:hypothetical protein
MTDLPMAAGEETAAGEGAERRYVPHRRNPVNAPGPFYTEANSCIACCLPEGAAPDLIGFNGDDASAGNGGFFKKQPETPEELGRQWHWNEAG